ncbi:hypothetical protein BpHYR1_011059, partial [Brachionus plicatilis]
MRGSWCKTKKSDKKDTNKLAIANKDALAILSCRLGTIRPLLTSTAQNLSAMNMAVCTFVNHDENFFKIEYPSEPIFANSTVFYFNQIKTYENKTQSGLRCFAVQCISKEPGIDFLIPVIYSLNYDSFDKMSAILVQTKLHAIPIKIYITKLKSVRISRPEIETPSLVIYMQLGKLDDTFVHDIGSKLKNRAVIYSEVISTKVFCSIDSDAETALINFYKSQNCSYYGRIENML